MVYCSREACSKTFFEKQVLCENRCGPDKELPDRGQAQLCQEMKVAVGGLQWRDGHRGLSRALVVGWCPVSLEPEEEWEQDVDVGLSREEGAV